MTTTSTRIQRRALGLGIGVSDAVLERLVGYYDLLQHWNEKINLTSLGDSDEALDRLIMEPVAAAAHLPAGARLVDIGSGGGSPALPLAIALGSPSLMMVESRGRKAAFLREALRTLELPGAVETDRAEDLAGVERCRGCADVVSMRAVRMTPALAAALSSFLVAGGELAVFSRQSEPVPDGFKPGGAHPLVPVLHSFLHCFRKL